MSFQKILAPVATAVGILAVTGAAWAHSDGRAAPKKQTLTITLDGTLGPIISGSDPAGLNGESATVTINASEALKPYKSKSKSASYHLPVGAITVTVNGSNYSSTTKSIMTVTLGKTADTLSLKSSVDIDGFTVQVSDVTSLALGSWPKTVLQHPALFSPSPQTLTEPSSNFTYSVFGETTELGVSGTASDSDPAE